jgi:Recombination endonuclease VII
LPSTEAQKAYARAHYHANREKRLEQQKAWQKENRDRKRAYDKASSLKRTYGISKQKFDEMVEAQDHKCAVCGSSEPGGRGTWKVDHCHASGAVRGLLCNGCNVGLGYFKDNQDALLKAAAYLKEHASHAS